MLKVLLQDTIYSDMIAGMQTGNAPWVAPKGPFYLLDGIIAPYTPQPNVLRIETDRINEPILITVDRFQSVASGTDIRERQQTYTVVANSSVVTVGVQLGRGRNLITVENINRSDEIAYLIVNATTVVSIWESFSRVLYSVSKRIIEEQTRAVSSELATRLLEPFVSFQNLLPDIQSLKILAIRLLSKGLIHEVGSNLGVTEMLTSLSLSTPLYRNIDKDSFEVYPALDPWVKSASQFGGREAHVWLPNLGISSWLAFLGYVSNQPDLYTILKISETEVVIEYQGEVQRHLFDFDKFGTSFLTSQSSSECFKSIVVNVSMRSKVIVAMCAATYSFDLFITSDNMLGNYRTTFDENKLFDSNLPFDSDPVDPFTDGWVGLSLSGRFEQDSPINHVLDTYIVPSSSYAGSLCGYEGWYAQTIGNHKYDMDVPFSINVSGWVQEAFAWILESPNGTKWDIRVNPLTKTLVSSSDALTSVTNFKVFKPNSSDASFSITNDGEIQVISPAVGGGVIMNTLYIMGLDSSVWWVTVNNSNELETTKIFPS